MQENRNGKKGVSEARLADGLLVTLRAMVRGWAHRKIMTLNVTINSALKVTEYSVNS